MQKDAANIAEIFSSIQGEGLTCGERQIFLRFAGCNLRCEYCDTPDALERQEICAVEQRSGRGIFRRRPNPVAADELVQIIKTLNAPPGLHHSVALTGGEPLLQAGFLCEFLPANKTNRIRHHLETNGVLPEQLESVIDFIDIISADIKIESSTGEPPQYEKNRRFLEVAFRKPTWVKVVVADKTTPAEIDEVAQIVASVSPAIPMILQPVTPRGGAESASANAILSLHKAAKAHLSSVRVIPQIHKILNLR